MSPIPYTPKADDMIIAVLLCCFFLTSMLLSRCGQFVWQLAKDFMLHRERNSIFDTASVSEMRSLLLFILQTCLLAGVCFFICFNQVQPDLLLHVPSLQLLGIYVGACLVYLGLKWVVYHSVGWIFFKEEKVTLWFSSYTTLLYYLGFALFPLVLCMVFSEIPLSTLVIIGLSLAIIAKILTLYKWIKLFCDNYGGCLLLIAYFCALEIIPCLVLFRGMVLLNDCLIIKI